VSAAALVADPAGDADGETEVQIGAELVLESGEAMRHAPVRDGCRMLFQDRQEILVSVALVQEERLADARSELELPVECGPLRFTRGEIAEVVEATFTHGHDFGRAQELFQARNELVRARDSASRLLGPLEPVTIICVTPAAMARVTTSPRSASKLSCARLTPMSTRATPLPV
jgi:hypothetical protein